MPASSLGRECQEYIIPGNELSPDYFEVNPTGEVVIKDSEISQLIVDQINNPFPNAQAVGVTISVGVSISS